MLATSLPRCQAEARPDEAAAAGGGLGAPAVWASEGLNYVQAVRTAVGLPAPPRATGVLGFDPDMVWVQLGADGEVPGPAAGVQDGVGRQLGRDEDGIGGRRAPRQVADDSAADMVQLVSSPRVGSGV